MEKFGLIGTPIRHSLSPALFTAGYKGEYTYDLIEEESFTASFSRFISDYKAINVTAPYKEEAFEAADIHSEECKIIKAANILIKTDEGIKAHNSDAEGVMACLREIPFKKGGLINTVFIVGCGGAAKAAAYAACKMGFDVIITNRTHDKALDMAKEFTEQHGFNLLAVDFSRFAFWFKKSRIIIYTLPSPIPAIEELGEIHIKGGHVRAREKFIIEANYKNPAFSEDLLHKMKEINPKLKYISGKSWLLGQAIGGYELFTGKKPDIEAMGKVL
jgi:shikimate dehydrogenase